MALHDFPVRTRKDIIEQALGSVYARDGKTKGTMVESCAKYLDSDWDRLVKNAERNVERGSKRDMHYEIHMQIWNWFPGGGTAEMAADRIVIALTKSGFDV